MEKIEVMEMPVRKQNRLKRYDYSQNGAYFITICTKDKKCILSHTVGATIGRPAYVRLTEWGKMVDTSIRGIPEHYNGVHVEKYVIMPNHIHLLIVIDVPCGRPLVAPTVSRVVQQMKGYATKLIGQNIWQKSFHDHVIRKETDFQMIWQYIDTNPAKWEQDCFYTEE